MIPQIESQLFSKKTEQFENQGQKKSLKEKLQDLKANHMLRSKNELSHSPMNNKQNLLSEDFIELNRLNEINQPFKLSHEKQILDQPFSVKLGQQNQRSLNTNGNNIIVTDIYQGKVGHQQDSLQPHQRKEWKDETKTGEIQKQQMDKVFSHNNLRLKELEDLQMRNQMNIKFEIPIDQRLIQQPIPFKTGVSKTQMYSTPTQNIIITDIKGITVGQGEEYKVPHERIEWKGDIQQTPKIDSIEKRSTSQCSKPSPTQIRSTEKSTFNYQNFSSWNKKDQISSLFEDKIPSYEERNQSIIQQPKTQQIQSNSYQKLDADWINNQIRLSEEAYHQTLKKDEKTPILQQNMRQNNSEPIITNLNMVKKDQSIKINTISPSQNTNKKDLVKIDLSKKYQQILNEQNQFKNVYQTKTYYIPQEQSLITTQGQNLVNVYRKTEKQDDFEIINTKEDINQINYQKNYFEPSLNQRTTFDSMRLTSNPQKRQTEFFSSNPTSSRDITGNKFRYTVERQDDNRKTYYVKRQSSLLKDMRGSEDFILNKQDIMGDNTTLEQTYTSGLSLRESKSDFKVYRVNEEYMSSQPRKIEVVFQNSRTEQLPKKYFDKNKK